MKVEFTLNRINNQIQVGDLETGLSRPFVPSLLIADLLYEAIYSQLPQCFEALLKKHKGHKFNMLRNFILCNLIGNDKLIDFDSDNSILNLEERFCSASQTRDCHYAGVICSPKRLVLTEREKEIIEQKRKGFSLKQIAGIFHISENTAKNHITNALRNNHKHNFLELLNAM